MYITRKLAGLGCVFLFVTSAPSYAAPKTRAEQSIRSGFALAQSCENEIDDDMGLYEECIGHAMSRAFANKYVLLGVHFQAWLVADLAARQNSPRATTLRQQQQRGTARQIRATGLSLNALCQLKSIDCTGVRIRMRNHIG